MNTCDGYVPVTVGIAIASCPPGSFRTGDWLGGCRKRDDFTANIRERCRTERLQPAISKS